MLNPVQKNMLQDDFEKFLKALQQKGSNLDFSLFGIYAGSILNFYVGSAVIAVEDKQEAALQLCHLFNAGLGRVISKSDLKEMAEAISQDTTLDYSVIQPVFGL